MSKFKGFFAGVLSSATFGMIPLFSLPLLNSGMHTESILCYRLIFAAIAVGILMSYKKQSFALHKKELGYLLICGILYYCSASLLFYGYKIMTSGLATTLHFLYPVFVTLIMHFVFKQKISPFTIAAIILALGGVMLLSMFGESQSVSIVGIIIVMISGASYAIYMVLVNNRECLRTMNNLKLTFYALLFCGLFFIIDAIFNGGITLAPDVHGWINLLLLALLPTLVSNIALVQAIKTIGSTLTAVLGAMEPLVAIIIGIFVFKENFTILTAIGIAMILVAVTLIIISPLLDKNIQARLERFSRNKAADTFN